MTGDSDVGSKCLTQESQAILGCKIDLNLTATQSMMGMLAGIDTADNDHLEDKLTQARWFAGVGTAGPAIVAGTMLIMFRIAMALFIGFGPIFILCLLFKKTAPLFQKWLYYGLATIFSGVMLAVMADIATDLVSKVALALFVSDNLLSLVSGNGSSGIMEAATQQLGLGLLLSTLLITVPPMAGMFFNGVMASFSPYSAIDRWNNPQGGGVPPHLDGGRSMTEQRTNHVVENIAQREANNSAPGSSNVWTTGGAVSSTPQKETIKTLTQAEKAALSITTTDPAITQKNQPQSNIGRDKGGIA